MIKREGMYLHFADGLVIDLSKERIQHLADEYWDNPSKLPLYIRQDDTFKACDICPLEGNNVLCCAIKPLLPFLEEMDRFYSYDKVTAIYVKKEGLQYVSETTMQNALQYVTNMSIFEYCEGAKRYYIYFQGIEPFMDVNEARARLLMNIYWLKRGDMDKVHTLLNELRHDLTVISKNCIKRLRLLSKSDAFMNAYVRTQILTEVLVFDINAMLEKYFKGKEDSEIG